MKQKLGLFVINSMLIIISCWLLGIQYIYLVAGLGLVAIYLQIPLKILTSPFITLGLYLFTDVASKHTDTHLIYQNNKVEFAQKLFSVNMFYDKIAALTASLLLVYLVVKILTHLKLHEALRNAFLLIALLSSLLLLQIRGASFGLTNDFYIVLFFLLIIFGIRFMYVSTDDYPVGIRKFLSVCIPPFFDNGYFVRHSEKNLFEYPTLNQIQITKKLVMFIGYYLAGLFLARVLFSSDFYLIDVEGDSVLPNIDLLSFKFHIQSQTPRILLLLSIFFKGLFFLLNIMSVTLLLESAYLIFGYRLKTEFNYQFKAKSFVDFFSQSMPMHAELIKEVFVFPALNLFGKYTDSKKLLYGLIFFSVFIGSTFINLIKFLSFQSSRGLGENICSLVKVDILSYGILFLAFIIFRRKKLENFIYVTFLNLLFIFILGVVVTIRFRSLAVPFGQKLDFFSYILGAV